MGRDNKDNGGANEKRLFHGTKLENVMPICLNNFDWRLYGSAVGSRYGQGAYFATNAKYSNRYTSVDSTGHKVMFVVKVLLGRSTTGSSSMRRPPAIDSSVPVKLYDSTANDKDQPQIHCLYENSQFYPEYVVQYLAP
jgi:poly [ADP-ribose] polymerase 7/11/12/13